MAFHMSCLHIISISCVTKDCMVHILSFEGRGLCLANFNDTGQAKTHYKSVKTME